MTTTSDTDRTQVYPESALHLDRRTVLAGAGVVAGGLVLAACSASGGSTGTGGGTGGGTGDGSSSVALADIPDGSAAVVTLGGQKVVLRRTGSAVAAVSAICTHQGCTVQVATSDLQCPCHGSAFQFDGTVINGPATQPLPTVSVQVASGQVSLG